MTQESIKQAEEREEDLPTHFYIFCNQFSFLTQHNLRVAKRFTSAGFSEAISSPSGLELYVTGRATYDLFEEAGPSTKFMSPFQVNVINDYRVEHDAEQFRLRNCPLLPSRFSATFAFGDIESCEMASKKYGWPMGEVKKFKLLDSDLNRVAKVNMEVVSLARSLYGKASWSPEEIGLIWSHYWGGKGSLMLQAPDSQGRQQDFESGVLWEYLIEGAVELDE